MEKEINKEQAFERESERERVCVIVSGSGQWMTSELTGSLEAEY